MLPVASIFSQVQLPGEELIITDELSSSSSTSSSSSSSSSSSLSSSASIALSTRYADWALDPTPVRDAVNAAIGKTAQEPRLISVLVNLVVDYLKKNESVEGFFGPEQWEKFCGKVGPAPALPDNIENIWQSQCPAFPEKRVCETHMFVYIPKTVNGKSLTLKSLGEIAKRYFLDTEDFRATVAGYRCISNHIVDELGDEAIEKSCWVLMTKDVLPDSRCKNYAAQQNMVVELAKKVQTAAYEVPRTLEAAVCILTHYFKSHDSSKTRLFNDTYTRFQKKARVNREVLVGGFTAAGLGVYDFSYGYDSDGVGVAALRKF